MNTALKLIEGTKEDRDKYINMVDILDKVNNLIMLPDNKFASLRQVADFYEVEISTLRKLVMRKQDELKSDGMKKLNAYELAEYKQSLKNKLGQDVSVKGTFALQILPRSAILRIGMMLTESKVAEKIRDYLINIEKDATRERKNEALKYNSIWTNEIEQDVIEKMNKKISSGMTVIQSLKEVSKEVGVKFSTLNARWYATGNYTEALKDKIANETNEHLNYDWDTPGIFKNIKSYDSEKALEDMSIKLNKLFIDNKKNTETLILKISHLEEENKKLYAGLGHLWNQNKTMIEILCEIKNQNIQLKNELDEYKTFVNDTYVLKDEILEKENNNLKRKLKAKTTELQKANTYIAKIALEDNEPVKGTSFRMDRNGNLNKIK